MLGVGNGASSTFNRSATEVTAVRSIFGELAGEDCEVVGESFASVSVNEQEAGC